MSRRLREKSQEQESQQKEEIPSPHNEAGSETTKKYHAHDVVADVDENRNNQNPLLKIVFIQRVLFFVQQKGIVFYSTFMKYKYSTYGNNVLNYKQTRNLASIPRLFQLKNVTSSWNETVEFYFYRIPSDVVIRFCYYLKELVATKHPNSEQHAILARDAFVWISKFVYGAESAQKWCHCVYFIIDDNKEANRRICGTESVRDAIVAVSKYCTTPISAYWFCSLILILTYEDHNTVLFGTVSVRDAILYVSKYCTTPDSARYFCLSIGNLMENENNGILFATTSVRDAIVAVSKYCINPHSAANFCGAMLKIIYLNESNKSLFGIEAIRDAILSVSVNIGSYVGVYFCCRVIFLFHETNPTLFCVEQTVKALVKLSKIEMDYQSPESIYWFLNVVLSLLHSDQKLFDTPELRNAAARLQEVVNDPEEVENLLNEGISPLDNKLSNEEYLDKARQLCVEFQKVVSEKSEASSSA